MRKTNLDRLLARRPDGIFVALFEQGEIGPDLFRAACDMGLEGLVSKRRDRPYQAGRSKHWLKVTSGASFEDQAASRPAVLARSVATLRHWDASNSYISRLKSVVACLAIISHSTAAISYFSIVSLTRLLQFARVGVA